MGNQSLDSKFCVLFIQNSTENYGLILLGLLGLSVSVTMRNS